MATVAIYNSKGGVGKTTIALNLAALAASTGYRVLLWELDAQGDSGWIVNPGRPDGRGTDLNRLMQDFVGVEELIVPTPYAGLSLLPADENARNTDNLFLRLARERRLLPLFTMLRKRFDLILFDCSPGMGDANVKLLQAVDLIVAPCLPSPLAMRALLRVRDLVMQARGTHAPILPVFSMVDRRRSMHCLALEEHPDWPTIPYLSDVERMLAERAPLSSFAPHSEAAGVFHRLWTGIEAKLRQSSLIRRPPVANEDVRPHAAPLGARPRRSVPLGSVRRIYARAQQIA